MLNRVMLRKIENISESTPEIGLAPKFNRFWRVTPCPCLPSLVHIHQHVRELSCGQTDTQTYTHRVKLVYRGARVTTLTANFIS